MAVGSFGMQLGACPSVCLPTIYVCPSICLSVYPPIHPSAHPPVLPGAGGGPFHGPERSPGPLRSREGELEAAEPPEGAEGCGRCGAAAARSEEWGALLVLLPDGMQVRDAAAAAGGAPPLAGTTAGTTVCTTAGAGHLPLRAHRHSDLQVQSGLFAFRLQLR